MIRPLTPKQATQNAAFLAALRRTGNVRAAAETLGLNRSMLIKRRGKHPAFAADWDAALVFADANPPSRLQEGQGEGPSATPAPQPSRTPSGGMQLRRSSRRRLTHDGEQRFLAALSATANVRLSAAAAGFSYGTFYARRRKSPAFAREMRLALQCGYERIEAALLHSFTPGSHADDAWRHNEPPPMPRMTVTEALQLLKHHQTEARLLAEPPHIKRRRGESSDACSFRLAAMYRAQLDRDREAFAIAEAERQIRGERAWFAEGPALPALDQVTGWSRAGTKRGPKDGG
ncbi:hypothetical protein FSB78_11205 [Sphingomonas ginsenosidivorax]|uniref:DNA binding HTH domain-containing protein n=1 Tax=Sphingomonas ginsenosidivorax TaxID=862135 RepID=A0A5C6UHD1_9SPHN|nr:hypothetical protein [Sphingomonas ginsenosidivorax]TXC71445.1 hypothetical protein FSB78_11205 [Sphingomonas ginsenosidivorax]